MSSYNYPAYWFTCSFVSFYLHKNSIEKRKKYAHPRPPVTIGDFGDFINDGYPPLKRKNAKLTFPAKTNNTR